MDAKRFMVQGHGSCCPVDSIFCTKLGQIAAILRHSCIRFRHRSTQASEIIMQKLVNRHSRIHFTVDHMAPRLEEVVAEQRVRVIPAFERLKTLPESPIAF